MLRTLLRDERKQFRVIEDPSLIDQIVRDRGRYLWLDLEKPTDDEFRLIQEEFHLHPLAIEDAKSRHQRPKIDQYDSFYLVVFYSVAIEEPGAGEHIPGRRGLRGSHFIRPVAQSNQDAHDSDRFPAPDSQLPPTTAPQATGNPRDEGETVISSENGDTDERIVLRELTMFLGENFLITVHNHPIPELDEAARRWRRNAEAIYAALDDDNLPGTRPLTLEERRNMRVQDSRQPLDAADIPGNGQPMPGAPPPREQAPHSDDTGILLYSLLDTIVDNYFPVIDSIVDRIEDLEEQIFERYSNQAIESIFILKKDLLALRKVLAPERDVLNILTRRDIPIFDRHTIVYFQDVYDHVVRITDSIDTYRDLLSSALDSFLSMQSNRLNVTVQTLTAVSIILMSVAAITGWYGMNFAAMPELTSRFGYPGVFVVVALIVALEVIYFKRKRWL
jgi:Mg2+ and Co2+ transporter CorA